MLAYVKSSEYAWCVGMCVRVYFWRVVYVRCSCLLVGVFLACCESSQILFVGWCVFLACCVCSLFLFVGWCVFFGV